MATIEQIGEALKNAHASGDIESATKLAHAYKDMQSQSYSNFTRPERDYAWSEVPEQFVKNLPSTGAKVLEGVANMVAHPIDTASNALSLAAGEMGKVLPESASKLINKYEFNPEASQKSEQMANAVNAQYAKDYGSTEGIKRKLAEDPAGALMDLSTLASGGGALASKIPAIAKYGEMATKLGKYTNPLEMTLEAGGKGLTNLYDLTSGNKAKVNAGLIGRGALGASLDPTLQALANAPNNLTASQAAYGVANAPFHTLTGIGESIDQVPYFNKYKEQRALALANIDSATPNKANAEAIRNQNKAINYSIAEKSTIPVTNDVNDLVNRLPSSVIKKAKEFQKAETGNNNLIQNNFSYTGVSQPFMTGATAIRIGKALKEIHNGMETGQNGKVVLGNLRSDFLNTVENLSPELKTAREQYAKDSKPVNEAQVIEALRNYNNPAENIYNDIGFRKTVDPIGQEKFIQNVLGSEAKGGLSSHISPQAEQAIMEHNANLIRNQNIEEMANAGKGQLDKISKSVLWREKLPSLLNWKISAANKALDVVENKVAGATGEEISRAMISPSKAYEMLQFKPADERLAIIKSLKKSAYPFSKLAPLAYYETNQQ